MVKSVIKEICIMILLGVAIILVLGVIFYDYIPSNKVLPNKLEAYTTPEDIQSEIDEEVSGLNQVQVSYEITSSDLDLYEQAHSYTSGKADPFSESVTTDDSTTDGGTAVTNSDTTTNTNTDSNSTGTFFNVTGQK